MVELRGVPGTPLNPRQDSGDVNDCGTAVVWWGESLGLPSVPTRTQGMGRTVRQQWYGGTQGIESTREDSVGLSTFVGLP